MATASRAEDSGLDTAPVESALREDACSFEFFQAVTLLHRILARRDPVGRFSNPEAEAVRFRAHTELAFPASQIQEIEWEGGEAPRMAVNFMGLQGPMGVLPHCYSELLLERIRAKDKSLVQFLDIFNHRAISLFYRAWEKHRFPVTYGVPEQDLFTRHLMDVIGLGTDGLQDRQAVPDDALLHFAGHLGRHARSAVALEALLHGYFEVPVEVEQFTGAWYRLSPDTLCYVGEDDAESEQLGSGAVVGDEIWNQQSRVRIKLGPLSLSRYRDFLPDGTAYEPLRAMVRLFSNNEFDFDVQLVLEREQVPSCSVGFDDAESPQLGWVTWLKSKPMDRDPSDTILNL
jgi:type VI secretion system protein ImpH